MFCARGPIGGIPYDVCPPHCCRNEEFHPMLFHQHRDKQHRDFPSVNQVQKEVTDCYANKSATSPVTSCHFPCPVISPVTPITSPVLPPLLSLPSLPLSCHLSCHLLSLPLSCHLSCHSHHFPCPATSPVTPVTPLSCHLSCHSHHSPVP